MKAPIHKIYRSALAWLTLFALGLGSGCKSYQLGHPADLPFETIYIQPAKNDSFAPQAQALLSSEVREAVIRDGRVKLVADPSAADAVLIMTLTDYERIGGTSRQNDTERAQDFDLILGVQLDLYDQVRGEYLFEGRRIQARTHAYQDNPFAAAGAPQTQDLIQSEYNAMPRLTRELGRKAADALLSAW